MLERLHENQRLRTRLIKGVIVIAFVGGILLSQPLWLNEGRMFPTLPPFGFLHVLSFPFDVIVLLIFIVACLVWVGYEKRWVGTIAVVFLTVILLQDQMRWQPWVYLYFLMLLTFLYQSNNGGNEERIVTALQWIIAGVYVWSGIHKLNSGFLDGALFQWMRSLETFQNWNELGYIIPAVELSIGLGLLTSRFRRVALYAAVTTHLFILFYLSPIVLNHNSVVYPWNASMIILVYLLFFPAGKEDFRLAIQGVRVSAFLFCPVILIWVFPFFNFFGYWDHYLSFSLYSGKPSTFYIAIEKDELDKLDKKFGDYYATIEGLQGGELIVVDKWALAELNVPFYPETRLLRRLSRSFCKLGIEDDKLVFLEIKPPGTESVYERFTCREMTEGGGY